jgi:hypothetical protein
VDDFYTAFLEEFGRDESDSRMSVERNILIRLQLAFRRHYRPRQIRELFAAGGVRSPREMSRWRLFETARAYGRAGKPPKLRFARWAVERNKALIEKGYHKDDLLGPGTTDVGNMHHYVKEMLKKKECRECVETHYKLLQARKRGEKIS